MERQNIYVEEETVRERVLEQRVTALEHELATLRRGLSTPAEIAIVVDDARLHQILADRIPLNQYRIVEMLRYWLYVHNHKKKQKQYAKDLARYHEEMRDYSTQKSITYYATVPFVPGRISPPTYNPYIPVPVAPTDPGEVLSFRAFLSQS